MCQYLKYDGKHITNKCGAPQGSICRPLLFIITLNDIGNISQFRCSIYKLMIHVLTFTEEKRITQICELSTRQIKLPVWLKSNNLLLNVQNTCTIVF